jgi:hypothetical protein
LGFAPIDANNTRPALVAKDAIAQPAGLPSRQE